MSERCTQTASSRSYAGFFASRNIGLHLSYHQSVRSAPGIQATTHLMLLSTASIAPVMTHAQAKYDRTWAVQGVILSPRLPGFGADKVFWICRCQEARERPQARRPQLSRLIRSITLRRCLRSALGVGCHCCDFLELQADRQARPVGCFPWYCKRSGNFAGLYLIV